MSEERENTQQQYPWPYTLTERSEKSRAKRAERSEKSRAKRANVYTENKYLLKKYHLLYIRISVIHSFIHFLIRSVLFVFVLGFFEIVSCYYFSLSFFLGSNFSDGAQAVFNSTAISTGVSMGIEFGNVFENTLTFFCFIFFNTYFIIDFNLAIFILIYNFHYRQNFHSSGDFLISNYQLLINKNKINK